MKRRLYLLTGLAVWALSLALPHPTAAQPSSKAEEHRRHPLPPTAGKVVDEIAAELHLEAATLQKVRALAQSADADIAEFEARKHAAFKEMRQLMDQDAPDRTAVLAQVERIGALDIEQKKIMVGTLLSVRELLTPEQRTRLKELMDKRRPPPTTESPPAGH